MTLQLKNISYYMGKKERTDRWIWTVFLESDKKDELDDIQYVIYNLGHTFTPPIAKVLDRESCFSLTREGSKRFNISARIEFKSEKDPIILEHELKFEESLQKAKFFIFLSTEDPLFINDKSINEFLEKSLTKNYTIQLIRRQKNIKMAKSDMDFLKNNSIFLVNANKQMDSVGYWELGYAMGAGIPIIGYKDGKSDILIPADVEELINIATDIDEFMQMINKELSNLDPKRLFMSNWLNPVLGHERNLPRFD